MIEILSTINDSDDVWVKRKHTPNEDTPHELSIYPYSLGEIHYEKHKHLSIGTLNTEFSHYEDLSATLADNNIKTNKSLTNNNKGEGYRHTILNGRSPVAYCTRSFFKNRIQIMNMMVDDRVKEFKEHLECKNEDDRKKKIATLLQHVCAQSQTVGHFCGMVRCTGNCVVTILAMITNAMVSRRSTKILKDVMDRGGEAIIEGVLIVAPLKIPPSTLPFLVNLKIFGKGLFSGT